MKREYLNVSVLPDTHRKGCDFGGRGTAALTLALAALDRIKNTKIFLSSHFYLSKLTGYFRRKKTLCRK